WGPLGPLALGTAAPAPSPAAAPAPVYAGGPAYGAGQPGYGYGAPGDVPVAGPSHPGVPQPAVPVGDAAVTVPDLPVLDAQGRPAPGRHRRP
ncbi:hypothetical protein DZF91_05410, partial [Actinomadura logoneensis]